MEQLREGLEAKIRAMLEERRRSGFIEHALISLFYFFGGIALSFIVWFCIDGLLWIFLFRHRGASYPSPTFINSMATFAFVAICIWKKEKIFQNEFDSAHESFNAESVSNTVRSFDALAGSVLISGPHFLVLSVRAARAAKKIWATDVFLLIYPIALAVQRRAKIRELDMAGLRIAWFLDNSFWIQGVVPLLRRPQGFRVTNEFIHEATGEEIPEPDFEYTRPHARFESHTESESNDRFDSESESETIDEEIHWARMLLGVERDATRADINSAYRKFAKVVHPDLHTNDPDERAANEEQMKDLNLAYEILRRSSR